MKTAKIIAEEFEQYLSGLEYSRQPQNLYLPIRYVLSLGGKRLRPTLLAMAYNMYADDDSMDRAFPAAAGIEIFHNFTLLHDDLMDKADMRRGNPTVHVKWSPNTAILSGDEMLVLAYRTLSMTKTESLGKLMDLASATFTEIVEGQQYDMDFETRTDVTEKEYIEMIRLKTSVLLAASAQMGAMIGGAPETDLKLIYGFGENIGLAFQLQDDLLDVYGDPAVFGKKIGGDILCNKKTWMYITAYNLADNSQKAELDRWAQYQGPDPQAKIQAVTSVYDSLGVRELAGSLIEKYFGKGLELLDKVALPDSRKHELKAFAASIMNRNL